MWVCTGGWGTSRHFLSQPTSAKTALMQFSEGLTISRCCHWGSAWRATGSLFWELTKNLHAVWSTVLWLEEKKHPNKIYNWKSKSWFCLSPNAAPCMEVGTIWFFLIFSPVTNGEFLLSSNLMLYKSNTFIAISIFSSLLFSFLTKSNVI